MNGENPENRLLIALTKYLSDRGFDATFESKCSIGGRIGDCCTVVAGRFGFVFKNTSGTKLVSEWLLLKYQKSGKIMTKGIFGTQLWDLAKPNELPNISRFLRRKISDYHLLTR